MFRKLDPYGPKGAPVTIIVNGQPVEVEEGEPVAAILLRNSPFISRRTPVSAAPRAPYCMMGACFECLVEIDGVTSTRSCMVRARANMVVSLQPSRPDPYQDAVA